MTKDNYRPRFVKKHGMCKDKCYPNTIIGNDELVEIVEDYRFLLYSILDDVEIFNNIDKKIG